MSLRQASSTCASVGLAILTGMMLYSDVVGIAASFFKISFSRANVELDLASASNCFYSVSCWLLDARLDRDG